MTSLASGPPGLEVKHIWNGFTMNDLLARPSRVRLVSLPGFHSQAPGDPQSLDFVNRSGAEPLLSFTGARDITYNGIVQSKSLDGLRVLSTALRAALRDKNATRQMRLAGAVAWAYTARCIAFDMDDEQTTGMEQVWPFARPFSAQFRLYDRRFYAIDLKQTVGGANGASVAHTNQGNTETPPVISVPVANGAVVTLENNNIVQPGTAYGHAVLKFKALPAAGTLVVDFTTQRAKIGALDVTSYVDLANNSWWKDDCDGIQPGAPNFIKVSGASGAWTTEFYHAAE